MANVFFVSYELRIACTPCNHNEFATIDPLSQCVQKQRYKYRLISFAVLLGPSFELLKLDRKSVVVDFRVMRASTGSIKP